MPPNASTAAATTVSGPSSEEMSAATTTVSVGCRWGVAVDVAVDVRGGRLGPFAVTVDEHEPGALAGERDRGGASVADGGTRRLPRADDDGHASFELAGHDVSPFEASSPVWRIGGRDGRDDRVAPCLSR